MALKNIRTGWIVVDYGKTSTAGSVVHEHHYDEAKCKYYEVVPSAAVMIEFAARSSFNSGHDWTRFGLLI